jgi:hypothetical protein
MSDNFRQAGFFDLKRFEIVGYNGSPRVDVKKLIYSFNIYESMTTGSVRGTVELHETVGLLHNFNGAVSGSDTNIPLRGEEFILIEYEDFFGEVRKDVFFLYSITDVRAESSNNQAMWSYKLHFVSVPKVFAENERIRKSFRDTLISENVRAVFDQFYGSNSEIPQKLAQAFPNDPNLLKDIVIQETDIPQWLVVPNFNPEQTMHFFARKAWSANRKEAFSQTFTFFESREKFYFCTDEYMRDIMSIGGPGAVSNPRLITGANSDIKRYGQLYGADNTPEGQIKLMDSIIDIRYDTLVNVIDEINQGNFIRNTIELDIMSNAIVDNPYDYRDEFQANNGVRPNRQKLRHTSEFITERMDKEHQKYVIKDYSGPGVPGGREVRPNTNYPDLYNRKHTHVRHTNKNRVQCVVYGSNSVFAGDIVNLQMIKHQADTTASPKIDLERSGNYLVESIDNIFVGDVYTQRLVLTKNGGMFDASMPETNTSQLTS